MNLSTSGAEDFLAVSKRLKAAGQTGLRKELNKNIRKAAKPVIAATREQAGARIPRRGGLAARVVKNPQAVQVRTGAQTYGVRIRVTPKRGSGAKLLDVHGAVRHPVYGNRERWVRQSVPGAKGWFSDTAQRQAPEVRKDVIDAIQAVKRQVVGRG